MGALLGGQLGTRIRYRKILVSGLTIMSAGSYMLTLLGSTTSFAQMAEYVAVTGFGVGITFPAVVLAIQFSIEKKQIGKHHRYLSS